MAQGLGFRDRVLGCRGLGFKARAGSRGQGVRSRVQGLGFTMKAPARRMSHRRTSPSPPPVARTLGFKIQG